MPRVQAVQAHTDIPVRVRSRVKPSMFHNLTVLSAAAVASCLASGLSRHFRMGLPDAITTHRYAKVLNDFIEKSCHDARRTGKHGHGMCLLDLTVSRTAFQAQRGTPDNDLQGAENCGTADSLTRMTHKLHMAVIQQSNGLIRADSRSPACALSLWWGSKCVGD